MKDVAAFGVYVHFPFCTWKCNYCDFNVVAIRSIPEDRYADAIVFEALHRLPEHADRRLMTVYLGGGTPSLWSPAHVGQVLAAIEALAGNAALEVTLELNPAEATPERLRGFRDAGVTRVSVGVQALDDALLPVIERRHSAAEGLLAVRNALAAGFGSVTADLMFGLPGQTGDGFRTALQTLGETGVPHVSLYDLTVEPRTPFARLVDRGRVTLPDEDTGVAMWALVDDTLRPFGLLRYELSNFAQPGHESLHNGGYWVGRPYLGLGAGAHSMRVANGDDPVGTAVVRTTNRRSWMAYLAAVEATGSAVGSDEVLDRDTHVRERLFTGLRRRDGVSLSAMARELRVPVLERYGPTIARLAARRLVEFDGDRLRLSDSGLVFADSVAAEFF